jgi:hypothetical protein
MHVESNLIFHVFNAVIHYSQDNYLDIFILRKVVWFLSGLVEHSLVPPPPPRHGFCYHAIVERYFRPTEGTNCLQLQVGSDESI